MNATASFFDSLLSRWILSLYLHLLLLWIFTSLRLIFVQGLPCLKAMLVDSLIACTGSPGTGKTTLCSSLPMVLSMAHIAEQEGCLGAVQSDGAAEIDIAALVDSWQAPGSAIIDGHLSHLLPVEAILILRCHPEVLRKRLEERGYSPEKVQANVEIELLGGPWNDLIADERPILEIDCSLESRQAIVAQWIDDGCPHSTTADDAIDWVQSLVDERNPL